MVSARVRIGLAGLALMVCASVVSAQNLKPTLTASVNGTTVVLNWTEVPGAAGYQLFVQAAGNTIGPALVPGTSLTLPGVPPGSYLVAVRGVAGGLAGPLSDPVAVNVAIAPPAPPPPPSNFAAIVNNNTVALTWTVPPGAANVFLQAGNSPGGSELGTIPMGTNSFLFLPSLASGNYFLRLFSLGAGGPSAPSPDLQVTTPGCVAPAVLPFTATSLGSFVQMAWPRVPGAVGYRLDVANTPAGGANIGSFPFGPDATSFETFGIAEGDYYLTLHTTMSCGASAASAVTPLQVRPPVRLPAKGFNEATSLVAQAASAMGAQFRGDLNRSCGNNTWLFRVLRRLRTIDNRFGLNWKRGNVGDMSQDVIVYNFGDGPEELADHRSLFAWDVIGGHCGPNPRAQAGNITNTRSGSARWTIDPYIRAGFAP